MNIGSLRTLIERPLLEFKNRPSLVKIIELRLLIVIFQIFELVRFPFVA